MKKVFIAGAFVASVVTLTFAASRDNSSRTTKQEASINSCYFQDTIPKKKDTTRRPKPDSSLVKPESPRLDIRF